MHVLDAFGVDRGSLEPLDGGGGYSWRAADLVLKAGVEPRFVTWLAQVADQVGPGGAIRWSRPVPALDGRLVVGGWSAATWMAGSARPGDVDGLLDASARLHGVLGAAGIAWPGFLRARTDRAAVADRVAWGEEPVPRFAEADVVHVLDSLEPVLGCRWCGPDPQLLHGDLTQNVLFDEGGKLAPAVIGFAPYHRPSGYADALAVVDAVTCHGAAPAAAASYADTAERGAELLARAVAFRALSDPGRLARYRELATLVLTV
jgi:uncharacterized protein (TIGR02569 family)